MQVILLKLKFKHIIKLPVVIHNKSIDNRIKYILLTFILRHIFNIYASLKAIANNFMITLKNFMKKKCT